MIALSIEMIYLYFKTMSQFDKETRPSLDLPSSFSLSVIAIMPETCIKNGAGILTKFGALNNYLGGEA